MRRVALATLLGALLVAALPGAGRSQETRWILFVRDGSLAVVPADGGAERTLVGSGVIDADAAGPNTAFALVEGEGGTSVVRIRLGSGRTETVAAGAALTGLAASRGRVAVERRVEVSADVPRHLRSALSDLAPAGIEVLAPPRRPQGTTHTVASADRRRYELRFTNDPDGALSHAEQVNVFVSASPRGIDPLPGALEVEVRGTRGTFSCGASACFLDWREGPAYTVGEFGRPEDAIDFAESLRPIEELAGPFWQEGGSRSAPELVVLGGEETVLETVEGSCDCSFRPVDWDDRGRRLLVVTRTEGFTTVTEYGPDGPRVLHEADGTAIIDASYTPRGVAVLESRTEDRPGAVRVLGGPTLARRARAFDVEGSTLALVRGGGDVIVRDLETGRERRVATGASSVSIGPAPPAEPEDEEEALPPDEETGGIPYGMLGLAIGGALLLVGLGALLLRRR